MMDYYLLPGAALPHLADRVEPLRSLAASPSPCCRGRSDAVMVSVLVSA